MWMMGARREDYREVELDVMVQRAGGGQFPAHEKALIPASSLAKVSPGRSSHLLPVGQRDGGGRRVPPS